MIGGLTTICMVSSSVHPLASVAVTVYEVVVDGDTICDAPAPRVAQLKVAGCMPPLEDASRVACSPTQI